MGPISNMALYQVILWRKGLERRWKGWFRWRCETCSDNLMIWWKLRRPIWGWGIQSTILKKTWNQLRISRFKLKMIEILGPITIFWPYIQANFTLRWSVPHHNGPYNRFGPITRWPYNRYWLYFEKLKSTWHNTLSCSCQLQTIFGHEHLIFMS